jgi:aminopeptidase N
LTLISGLITYREKYLLYSPQLYSSRQQLHVATVVAHELAHQWFGNLVTMNWWDALWLNEGFATLMEYIGSAAISDGKFRMDEYFILDAMSSAFDRDARATSHPLIFPIDKAEDVTEAFDTITYDKVSTSKQYS